jgi:hypothetical protein
MKPHNGSAPFIFVLVAAPASACECAERRLHDMDDAAEGTTLDSEGTTQGAVTATGAAEGSSTGEPIDVSPFLGIFHAEHWGTPFGREVTNPGGVALANLEIRPDGTASMTMETCNELGGTREFAWTWEARPGPMLEFSPGPGEDSLDYFALTDLESLRAYLVDDCAFQFEAAGDLLTTETFRPGLACWVNRCDPTWTIHLDYCDGEEPPPCE